MLKFLEEKRQRREEVYTKTIPTIDKLIQIGITESAEVGHDVATIKIQGYYPGLLAERRIKELGLTINSSRMDCSWCTINFIW